MEIGSHGLLHTDLTTADDATLDAGDPAQPHPARATSPAPPRTGSATRTARSTREPSTGVRAAGYAYACAVDPGPLTGVHALPRVHVDASDTSVRMFLKRALHPLRRKPLPETPGQSPSDGTGRPIAPEAPQDVTRQPGGLHGKRRWRQPMKVAHIITGLGVGGAEQQLRLMLRHLPVRCDVFTLTAPGAVAEGILADGNPRHSPGHDGQPRRDGHAPARPLIRRRPLRPRAHPPLPRLSVRTSRGTAGGRTGGGRHRTLARRQARSRAARSARASARCTWPPSGSAPPRSPCPRPSPNGSALGRARRRACTSVPNGIDARRFRFDPVARAVTRARLGIPQDAYVVGGVGRLVPGKRFETLVRAVAVLPGVHLVLAGDGPERDTLQAIALALGADDRIHLLGECDGTVASAGGGTHEVPDVLAAMDIFVSPSSEEAFGLAVLEALASGLPALHVTCPAVDDLPSDQAPNAHRIGTSVPELTATLREYAAVGAVRLPVPPVVDRYDIERSAERLMAVYRAATGTKQLPAPAPPAVAPAPAPSSVPLTTR